MARAKRVVEAVESVLVPDSPLVQGPDAPDQPIKGSGHASKPEKKKEEKRIKPPTALVTSIIERLQENNKQVSKDDVELVCGAMIDTIVEMVKEGKTVTFNHKMTFKRALRDERVCKNLADKTSFTKQAHYVMAVDVMPALKKEIEAVVVVEDEISKLKAKKEKEKERRTQKATGSSSD